MLQKIIKYLGFSRSEARGFVVFFLLLFLVAVAPYIYEKYFTSYSPLRIEELKGAMNEINQFQDRQWPAAKDLAGIEFESKTELFAFNPNNLPIKDWMRLGLTEKQARAIKNYEAKGGKFYKKADVEKMYSISEKQYRLLEPYILIPERESTRSSFNTYPSSEREKPKKVMIELNTADSVALLQISGVGPVFASRIMKYRERLGGFVDEKQLREVWGIDSVKFEQIRNQVRIDPSAIRKTNVNAAEEHIKKLPYLNYKQKNAIIAYRKQHGRYNSPDDLRKIVLLDEEQIQKILPYITFND